MTTPDRTLGVAVCGVGWCAAQHIAAFQHNPRTRGHLAVRPRRGARARRAVARPASRCPARGSPPATRTCSRRRDVDIISIATPNHLHADAGGGGGAGRQAHRARKADRPRRRRAGAHSRRGAARRRADDRVVRAALQPVPEVRALAADRGLARRDPLRAHAVPVARHRLVQRAGSGSGRARADAATCSRPAATPSTRCAGARAWSRSR